jgi:hypothetical protein
MKGYRVAFGTTITFDSDDITVCDDGTQVEVKLDTGGEVVTLRLNHGQAQVLLVGLRLTGTAMPDWML